MMSELYTVESLVAEGGGGRLYRARAKDGTVVALKKYRATDNASAKAPLVRELSRLERLTRHENVATFLALTVHDGEHAVVQEWLDGVTLESLLRRHLPLPAAVEIVRQVLCGLGECIHPAGLVHQDLSPDNLLIMTDGTVKIIDFGAAGVSGTHRTNDMTGKLRYCSPEQASGAPLDARSDLYSLGAIFYELVTGATPYTGSDREIHTALLREHPIRPASELDPLLPETIAHVIAQLLAPDREARYQSAAAALANTPAPQSGREVLQQALRDAENDTASTPPPRGRSPLSRAAALATVVLLVGLGFGAGVMSAPQIDSRRNITATGSNTSAPAAVAARLETRPKSAAPSPELQTTTATAIGRRPALAENADHSHLTVSPHCRSTARAAQALAYGSNESQSASARAPALSSTSETTQPAHATKPHIDITHTEAVYDAEPRIDLSIPIRNATYESTPH
ncbi:MAG: hypothetical protein Tsb0020_10550 [Haliangiales bacterium]